MPTLSFFQPVTPGFFNAFQLGNPLGTPVHTAHTYELQSNSPWPDTTIILTSSAAHPFHYIHDSSGFYAATSGTVVSMEGDNGSGEFFTLTGISVSVTNLSAINLGMNLHIVGSSGDDLLGGGLHGNDTINGGGGNDTIIPGTGNDRLTGGAGDDHFRFTTKFGNDVITDFTSGQDKIEFSHTLFKNFHQVKTHSHVVHGDVVIELNANETITLNTVHHVSDLHSSDFVFF